MAWLHLEPVPPRAGPGEVVKLLCTSGGLDRQKIGRIELRGRRATVDVPESWQARLVKQLDGAEWGNGRVRVWGTSEAAPAPGDHFARLARLLEMESREALERARQLAARLSPADAERSGQSIVDLVVDDVDTGLGGRFIVSLVKRNRTLALPWTRISVGSPVVLSQAGDVQPSVRGIVCRRRDRAIDVACAAELVDADAGPWRVDASTDEIATQRQRAALDRAAGASGERLADLRRVLLGERPPRYAPPLDAIDWQTPLDASQQDAVRFALSAQDVALIHGPPGTGKTTTLVELIRQAVRRGDKVLACAPSNLAVDNLLERLVARGERAVRIGHPARVLETLREHTLDELVERHQDVRLARKLVKEALAMLRRAGRYTRAKPEPGERQQLRSDARSMLADARRLESLAAEEILDRASVVCATTTGLDSELLGRRQFNLVVIDEACQSTEPGCWPPILRADKVVLAGDHCQLPPTVVSPEAAREGFAVSMFERLIEQGAGEINRRLVVQYRMHESIMGFSSGEFYDGQLQADAGVAGHLLTDLSDVAPVPLTAEPLEFIDTAGAGYDEEVEPDGESRRNPQEAELVTRKVTALLEAGVEPQQIAVIAPYAAQVRLLRERLPISGLEVDSVDGFQGREKEAVIISLVRSNPSGEIGFLSDVRRMNVAMTRARRKLLMIGDSATLASDSFYTRLLEYVEAFGKYRTVWDEL